MDLLNPARPIDLSDPEWKIYFRNPVMPPHYASAGSVIQNSLVSEGCDISGGVDFSVLFSGVIIEPGAQVNDSIVMSGAVIKMGAVINYAIIGEGAVVCENAVVGARPEDIEDKNKWGVTVVGPNITVGPAAQVAAKTVVSSDLKGGDLL